MPKKPKRYAKRDRRFMRVFAVDPTSGEPACYCGTVTEDYEEIRNGVGSVVIGLIDGLLSGERDSVVIELTAERMTDREIAKLPEC